MKNLILSIVLLVSPAICEASVTIKSDSENLQISHIAVTVSSTPSNFSGISSISLAVSIDDDSETNAVEIHRFTLRADSASLIDSLIVPVTTTGNNNYPISPRFVIYDDEIVSETFLSGAPEPTQVTLSFFGLMSLIYRRRR